MKPLKIHHQRFDFRWLLRESRGSIEPSRNVQTYWNILCMVLIHIDQVTKYQMKKCASSFQRRRVEEDIIG
jgi:hypothetical protein